jgi:hypothetical protein
MCGQVADMLDQFAPNRRWHVDTLITMLTIAGNFVPDNVVAMLVTLIGKRVLKRGETTCCCVHVFVVCGHIFMSGR